MVNFLAAIREPRDAMTTAVERLFPADAAVKRMARWRHGSLRRVDLMELVDKELGPSLQIFYPFDRKIGTSVDLYELVCISALALQFQPKIALEIGTFDGNTTVNIAANLQPECKVYTLELPQEWNGPFEIDVPESYKNVTRRSEVGRQIRGSGFEDRIQQLYGDSASFDWNKVPQPLGLVFIDGNHFYDYVKRDTENALNHVGCGGCVIWHDYAAYRDVSRAVDEFSSELDRVVAIHGTRLAVAAL